MTPDDAEDFTRTLATSVACGWKQIAWGQKIGIPKALGLSTEQWVERLGGYVKLASKERYFAELTLKADGLSNREIGSVIGLSDETVRLDLAKNLASSTASADAQTRSVREQRQERRAAVAAAAKEQAALPDAKFRVVYADPPWSYSDKADAGSVQSGGAEQHYPSMTIAELCALPVESICEPNAVLFLWTTSPLLVDAFAVVDAWGFTYKSSFVWDKHAHNRGHYNSVRHEFLLVCVRGSCLPDVPKLFDSVQKTGRTEHSEKPNVFRIIIDTLYPNGKRVELFARETVDGWTAWGNEIESEL